MSFARILPAFALAFGAAFVTHAAVPSGASDDIPDRCADAGRGQRQCTQCHQGTTPHRSARTGLGLHQPCLPPSARAQLRPR